MLDYIRERVDRYCARPSTGVPPVVWQTAQQADMVLDLMVWSDVFKQVFQLAMQYWPADQFERITGMKPNWDRSMDEINFQYDLIMNADVKELDTDAVASKVKAVTAITAQDQSNAIDKHAVTSMLLRTIDPQFGGLLKSPQSGQEEVMKKVQDDMLKLGMGMEPVYDKKKNPAAGMELQFAQQILQQSPQLQKASQDPEGQKLFENYFKNKQQMVAQQENIGVGQSGVQELTR